MDMNFPTEDQIPDEFILKELVIQNRYLINGNLKIWNGAMKEVLSPIWMDSPSGSSQMVVGRYPRLSEKEAHEALIGAVRAYDNGRGLWPTMSVDQRIKHIEKFSRQMVKKKKEVVTLMMWEIGKSLRDSEKEFDRTVEYINGTIDELKKLDRICSRFTIEQGIIGQIRRAPLGVALCMGPFNYPLNETFTTLIPALIMGNTVLFKPPKLGVLLFNFLLEAFCNSFPPGVINTIYGEGAEVCGTLMKTGKIDVLAFIGTSRVADVLKKQHPKPHRLRCVLGLEAKNPAIILQDADLELSVKECVQGTLAFNGQRCTALKILFVHTKIVDLFLARFREEIEKLKIGMPWDTDIHITPLPEPGKPERLSSLIQDAQEKGAKILNHNGGVINKSLFIPAILYPVNPKMKIYTEEQFGPIIPVIPFDDIEVPINYVIASNYGQQASLFGSNPDELAKLIDPLVNQVCRLNLNSQCQRGPDSFPFTGRKDSAEGTLSVSDALRVFSIRTLVASKEVDLNREIISKIVKKHKSNFLNTDYIF